MKRRYIILPIVIFAAVIGLIFFWNYWKNGTLELSVPDNIPENTEVTVKLIWPDKTRDLTLKPGQTEKLRLSPDTIQVTVSAGELQSISIVTIEQRKTTKLTTPSAQQHAIQKLGTNPRFCPVVLTDAVYSYNCQASGPVIKHAPSGNITIYGGRSFDSLQPLQSGLIGFYSDNLTTLKHLTLQNESIQTVQLPSHVQTLLEEEMPQIITSDDPSDPRFALQFSTGNKIYVFDSLSDAEPLDLQLGSGVAINQPNRVSSVSLDGAGVVVYVGADFQTEDGEAGEEVIAEQQSLPSYIFEYNNTGDPTKTISLGDNFNAEAIYRLTDNYYLAERPEGFEFYFYDQNNFRSIYALKDVNSWIAFQDKIYIQANDGLFLFAPTDGGMFTLESVFSWPTMSVSNVFSSVKGLIFTAFLEKSSSAPLNIYQLLDALAQPGETPPGVVTATEPEFIDFEKLLDFGVSSVQLDSTKKTLTGFTQASGEVDEIVLTNPTAEPRSRFSSSTVDVVTFGVSMDGQSYAARLEYSNLTTIRLYLYDSRGAVAYDSQTISN